MDIMGSVNRDREMSQGTEQIVAGKDAGAAKLLKSLSRTVVRATTVAAGLGVVRGFAAIELAWMASGVIDAAAFPDPRKLPVGIFLAALAAIAARRRMGVDLRAQGAVRDTPEKDRNSRPFAALRSRYGRSCDEAHGRSRSP